MLCSVAKWKQNVGGLESERWTDFLRIGNIPGVAIFGLDRVSFPEVNTWSCIFTSLWECLSLCYWPFWAIITVLLPRLSKLGPKGQCFSTKYSNLYVEGQVQNFLGSASASSSCGSAAFLWRSVCVGSKRITCIIKGCRSSPLTGAANEENDFQTTWCITEGINYSCNEAELHRSWWSTSVPKNVTRCIWGVLEAALWDNDAWKQIPQVLKRREKAASHYFLPHLRTIRERKHSNVVSVHHTVQSNQGSFTRGHTSAEHCCSTQPKTMKSLRTLKNQSQNREIWLTVMEEAVGKKNYQFLADGRHYF